MNLNDCNINELIIGSKLKFQYKRWIKQNLIMFGMSSAIAAMLSFVVEGLITSSAFLAIGACALAKAGVEIGIFGIVKYQANKKLQQVVNILRQDGLKVSRFRLQKAKMGMKKPEQVVCGNTISEVTESVTVFKDNLGDLKALRQVRSQLIRELKQEPQDCIVRLGDYTEIIEDSEEAKKILVKLDRRRK